MCVTGWTHSLNCAVEASLLSNPGSFLQQTSDDFSFFLASLKKKTRTPHPSQKKPYTPKKITENKPTTTAPMSPLWQEIHWGRKSIPSDALLKSGVFPCFVQNVSNPLSWVGSSSWQNSHRDNQNPALTRVWLCLFCSAVFAQTLFFLSCELLLSGLSMKTRCRCHTQKPVDFFCFFITPPSFPVL